MADPMPLDAFLADCRQRTETTLERLLPPASEPPGRLHEAMRYAVLGGGKRVRPTLTYATARALGLAAEWLDHAAAAVELIHAYSLVHDDLPAMDDDDLRRGRATCHKAFDEATAILAGDALQTLAFEALATDPALSATARIALVANLARASGSLGMCGGQALDLAAEGAVLDLVQLQRIHRHKTGALIRASVNSAVLVAKDRLADWDPAQGAALDRYAQCIGLAFQIQDDLLDVEGETAVIGKQRGADAAHHKATYPSLMGLESAHQAAQALVTEAVACLAGFADGADPLRQIAAYIVDRDR